jgi:hypothetical protein
MDLLYPVCAGIDVHRDALVVTVSRAKGRRHESETRTFGAVTEELRALVAWLDQQDVPIIAMESTGVYWKPVYRAIRTLSPARTVWLVNPARVKAVPGRKTDVKDSAWIAKRHQVARGVPRAARVGRKRSARQGGTRHHRGVDRRRADARADRRDGGP